MSVTGFLFGPLMLAWIILVPLFGYLFMFLGMRSSDAAELSFILSSVIGVATPFCLYAYAKKAKEEEEKDERDILMRTAEDVVASEAAIKQLERYEGEGRLKELAQTELETRREVIRLAKEGDVGMARLLGGVASFKKFQRETLENRDRRIKAKQEQLAAQQAAAQTEPKQVEEDSIRALLGARIKEMEAILGRLQAERERLANVASAEELDALEMEIRARQMLIHAINQGADDKELHLCVERIRAREEDRKEFEQMRLSDA